jgi:hypothetical protein
MNNNPFEPVGTEPADGNPPLTDDAADDFTADGSTDVNSNDVDTAPKAPLSIDGISPNYGSGDDDSTKVLKIDEDGDSQVENATSSNDVLTDDHAGDFLNDTLPSSPDSDSVAPSDDDSKSLGDQESAPIPPADVKPAKPVKTVKISLLTIIFLILAIAGIAGTVWFYLQNNKNADALADSEAKVHQLNDQLSTSSTTENTTAGQYDGLNDKIEDLTGKNSESQKTIDDYKKKNDELTKQVTDLTTKNADLTKQANNISSLTTRLDKVLPLLETAFGEKQ